MTDERDELNKMLHDLNQRFGTNFKLLGNVAMDVMKPTRRVEQKGDGYIVYVKPPAFFTQEEVAVPLTADQFKRYQYWREGMGTIQELLGDLSDSERERLMSGLTDENFSKAWGDRDSA